MAQKVKDLAVKTREYTDKEGNRKFNWQKIGVVMQNDDGGQFIILDRWFNLSGIPAGVLLIQSCMPSAILCYLIAHMYSPKEIVDNISSTIVVSTIMSLFTIPITLFFALKYFY